MLALVSIIMGIVPMVIYALLIWRIDRWEREPLPLVIGVFLWGFFPAIVLSMIVEIILAIPGQILASSQDLAVQLFNNAVAAPVTEEIFKAFAIAGVYFFNRKEFDSVLDGVVYGSLVGFGFAAFENILYFLNLASDPGGLAVLIFLRAFVFGLIHALFSSMTGIGFALARYSKSKTMRFVYPSIGLLVAIFLHAFHNMLATIGGISILFAFAADWMGIVGLFALVVYCLSQENNWIRQYLREEVDKGVVTSGQVTDAASYWKRSSLQLFSLGATKYREQTKVLSTGAGVGTRVQKAPAQV